MEVKKYLKIAGYVILAFFAIVPIVGLYHKNKDLKAQNENLSLDNLNLREVNIESQKYAQRRIDSISKLNLGLYSEIAAYKKHIALLESSEKTVILKYNNLYEKIRVTDNLSAQFDILNELLTRNIELGEIEAD